MNHKSVYNIASYCVAAGITDAIISPGSRNALLTLSFARHQAITCHVVPDERSAAFIALGLSQSADRPVALICTSGSAVLNYFPALSEAYFNQVPLLVLSADRPPEWIDQYDGQTIFQPNVFGEHVKYSASLPVSTEENESEFNHVLESGLRKLISTPFHPVHINVPIREPFYSEELGKMDHTQVPPLEAETTSNTADVQQFQDLWNQSDKVLIVPGQGLFSDEFKSKIEKLASRGVVVCSDIISDFRSSEYIKHHDFFLGKIEKKIEGILKPDLLVTFGRSIISKQLKLFLRNNKAIKHFHFETTDKLHDPFSSVTEWTKSNPQVFFNNLNGKSDTSYTQAWKRLDMLTGTTLNNSATYCELTAVNKVFSALNGNETMHLANSMPVRYANFVNSHKGPVFCNRGVSGIDGCTSTALGHAIGNHDQHILITGDFAFMYDVNAFWNKIDIDNLKTIVLNNGGGGIFRIIDGPSKQPELEDFFEFSQDRTALGIANEYNIPYFSAMDTNSLESELDKFLSTSGPALLEIHFDRHENVANYNTIKVKLQSEINQKINLS